MSPSKTPKRALKGQHKKSDTAQSKRFIEMARKLGADESPEEADRAFRKVTGKHGGKSPKS